MRRLVWRESAKRFFYLFLAKGRFEKADLWNVAFSVIFSDSCHASFFFIANSAIKKIVHEEVVTNAHVILKRYAIF